MIGETGIQQSWLVSYTKVYSEIRYHPALLKRTLVRESFQGSNTERSSATERNRCVGACRASASGSA